MEKVQKKMYRFREKENLGTVGNHATTFQHDIVHAYMYNVYIN